MAVEAEAGPRLLGQGPGIPPTPWTRPPWARRARPPRRQPGAPTAPSRRRPLRPSGASFCLSLTAPLGLLRPGSDVTGGRERGGRGVAIFVRGALSSTASTSPLAAGAMLLSGGSVRAGTPPSLKGPATTHVTFGALPGTLSSRGAVPMVLLGRLLKSAATHLPGLRGKMAGPAPTRCFRQTFAMAKQLPARRLEGIDHNPWVEYTQLAAEHDVVNLGQGFPDFAPPDFAVEAFQRAVSQDFMLNQYTKAFGYTPLTKVLAQFFGKLLGHDLKPEDNVLVTVGAYGALFTAFQALVDEGDEVILLEPFFDCYEPMTRMAGGRPVFMPLRPSPTPAGGTPSSSSWRLDPAELASKFTAHTKALVINTPNNPLGKVFSRAELEQVASLCQRHDVICISDEVYQWLVYDGCEHVSIASLPGMWERTLTIGSAGKSFSATGWKVGWVLGPDHLLRHLRTVHQNSVYHCPTQAQAAVAQSFQRELQHFGQPSSYFLSFPQSIQRNRDYMIRCLQSVGLRPIVPQGSYFLVVDISDFKKKLPDLPGAPDEPYDRRFVKWMIRNKGLAAIPVSIFFSPPHQKDFDYLVRFCFVKQEATLKAMEERLRAWQEEPRA